MSSCVCALHRMPYIVACTSWAGHLWPQVWYDEARERAGDQSYLVLWKPVPPAGYVPLGLVAGRGPSTPPPGLPIR